MLYEKLKALQDDPATLDTIFDNVANGGSLIELCEVWQVPYHFMSRWLYADETRKKMYNDALDARIEWTIQRLLGELKALAFLDVRKIFDENHALLPADQWPADVAKAIAGLDVTEQFEMDGSKKVFSGYLKKVKFYDKLKSIDLLGKQLGMFVQKHEVSGRLTLEDLVAGSHKNESIPRNTDERSQS